MPHDDLAPVLERLRELEGWAEYITEALHLNQRREPVKREMLERLIDRQALKQLREMSWSLRDKLHAIATQIEHSRVHVTAKGKSGSPGPGFPVDRR